jgi:hypothetical protein
VEREKCLFKRLEKKRIKNTKPSSLFLSNLLNRLLILGDIDE